MSQIVYKGITARVSLTQTINGGQIWIFAVEDVDMFGARESSKALGLQSSKFSFNYITGFISASPPLLKRQSTRSGLVE